MNVMTKLLALAVSRNQLIGNILRVAGHEPDSFNPLDIIKLVDEIREVHRLAAHLAHALVRVDILPQKRDFANAIRRQILHLAHDILRRTAPLATPRVRHYTICTKIIASIHDVDKSLVLKQPLAGKPLDDFAAVLPDFQLLLLLVIEIVQQIRQTVKVVRPENHVDPRVLRLDRVYHVLLLHHATANANREALLLFGLPALELPQRPEKPLVRILSDAASVDNYNVRVLSLGHFLVASLNQHPRQRLRIVLVHLASKRRYMKCFLLTYIFQQNISLPYIIYFR